MIRNRVLGAGAIALASILAGCQSKSVVLVKQDTGSWSATFSLNSFNVPGSPPDYRADLEKALAARSASAVCLTAEQAAKSDLVSELMAGQGLKNCEFDENRVEKGQLTAQGICEDPRNRQVDISINGTADAQKADLTIAMSGEEQANAPVMVTLHAVLTHTGPCADQAAPSPVAAKGK